MSGSVYSDTSFYQVSEEIEELLGDLLGIEGAARSFRDFLAHNMIDDEGVAPGVVELKVPAKDSFNVYPILPDESSVDMGSVGSYQAWLNASFEAGKGGAAGTGAWIRNLLAQHFYGVSPQLVIDAAIAQQDKLSTTAGSFVDGFYEVQTLLDNHWAGDSRDAVEIWFNKVAPVQQALFRYADAAQLAAGATGDVIAATQTALLRQAERCRDSLKDAVGTWREDNDVFPFEPGSGYKITEMILEAKEKVLSYAGKVPAGETIAEGAWGAASSKFAPLKIVKTGFTVLQELEAQDSDPATPATAQEIIEVMEKGMNALTADARSAYDKLDDKLRPLLGELRGEKGLVMDRLPRNPHGVYDRDGHNYGYTPPDSDAR